MIDSTQATLKVFFPEKEFHTVFQADLDSTIEDVVEVIKKVYIATGPDKEIYLTTSPEDRDFLSPETTISDIENRLKEIGYKLWGWVRSKRVQVVSSGKIILTSFLILLFVCYQSLRR